MDPNNKSNKKKPYDGPSISEILQATINSLNVNNSLDCRIESGKIADMATFAEDLMLGSGGSYKFIFKLKKVENQAVFINALSQARFNILLWKCPEQITGRVSYFNKPKPAQNGQVLADQAPKPTNLWDLLDVDKLAKWVEDTPHEVIVDVRYYLILAKLIKLDAISVSNENDKLGLLTIFMKNYFRFPSIKSSYRAELLDLVFDMLMATNGVFDVEIFSKSNVDIQNVLCKYQAHIIKLLSAQTMSRS
jgi:hypothetical protein